MNISKLSRARREGIAKVLVGIQFLILGLLGITALLNITDNNHSYLAFEAALVLIGGAVIASAGKYLRPSLRISPIPKADSPLIAVGIYKYVRHPMYLGVILIGVGLAGFTDSSLAWVMAGILVIDLNFKARFEDALLREIHPESLHYQLHTSRIIPCIGGSCRENCEFK